MSSAHVYNPLLHDVVLLYSGRSYTFLHGKTTIVEDQHFEAADEYMRNMANASPEDSKAVHVMAIPAVTFANQLMRRHQYDLFDAGFVVSDKPVTESEVTKARLKAKTFGTHLIDEFLQERRERMAGGMGRLTPDAIIIDWMVELGIHDDILNPAPQRPALDTDLLRELGTAVGVGVVEALENRGSSKR